MPRKLGEALARRAELQARLGEVRDRLRVSALAQEGDQPAEDPEPLLTELDAIAVELEKLIADINRTNAVTQISSGRTLTEALARRDVLGLLHGVLKAVADSTAQQQARYSRSEIRLVRTFDVAAVRTQLMSWPATVASLTLRSKMRTGPSICRRTAERESVAAQEIASARAATAQEVARRFAGSWWREGSACGFDSRICTDTPRIVTPAPSTRTGHHHGAGSPPQRGWVRGHSALATKHSGRPPPAKRRSQSPNVQRRAGGWFSGR
jgi:hypothetical protein